MENLNGTTPPYRSLKIGQELDPSQLAREESLQEYLNIFEYESQLKREFNDLTAQGKELCSSAETMELLHRYNDIKDATAAVMHAIAELRGLEWFNVSESLSVNQHFAGKLVLLDFFTYCCINCMHILPDLRDLERKFTVEDGLVVIGVHSAKFKNERESSRLLSAVQKYEIGHPVVNDSTLSCWRSLGIVCWPTLLLIGPMAQPLAVFVGEGHRKELFLYTQIALDYFKSLNRISTHGLPVAPARHLLPRRGSLLFPGKLAINNHPDRSSERHLVISDTGNHRVLITDRNGEIESIIGGGASGFTDGDFSTARFNAPQGVCFFRHTVYVADTENHAVRMIDLDSGTVITVAGTGSQGHDYVGGKIGREQSLSSPWDVAMYEHEYGNSKVPVLLIAAAGTHQIWALFLEDTLWWKKRKYRAGSCVAVVGTGREENRNNAYPHAAGLAQPSGLAVDQEGRSVFFADSESSAIRRIDLETGRVAAVCGGNKNPADLHDYGDVDGIGCAAKLQHPLGVAWDPKERVLYVADTYNHKIKRVYADGKCETVYGCGKPNEAFLFDEPGGLAVHSYANTIYVADTNNHAVKMINPGSNTVTKIAIGPQLEDPVGAQENAHEFDVTIDVNGGELTLILGVVFENGLKFNRDSPQKWSVIGLPDESWQVAARTGELSTPISIIVSKGNGTRELCVALDLIACTETACLAKRLRLLWKVHQLPGAASKVTEKKEVIVK